MWPSRSSCAAIISCRFTTASAGSVFAGHLFVEQAAGRAEFTINCPMVLSGLRAAPQDG